MRILVTGAAGFVGCHLIRELAGARHAVIACDSRLPEPNDDILETRAFDLRDPEAVSRCVADAAPDACVHMGALSFVPSGDSNPDLMLSVNIQGTLNVLDAFREHRPEARVLVVSTAQVYGPARSDTPISETADLEPLTVYAISKSAADLATLAYARHHGLHALTARPNNHTGQGQAPQFVMPSFVQQIRAIVRGEAPPILHTGNLDSERDFADVRDVVRSYRLLLEHGRAGLAYNISANNMMSIRAVLDQLCALANVQPELVKDPSKFRPTDRSPVLDVSRLKEHTGWAPTIDIRTTLADMLKEG